ncbi:hypothetical protein I305_03274 [Cryptococcus gattii E566]|nr:hypothetical protein I305_03274 [Cryptococcus gattii E566]
MDALCPCLCASAERAPEECDPGETHEIVCDGACEIDEVEAHLAGGHGCGAEEGGEGVEGVQQEEALAHEREGGDAERQPAAMGAEPAGGGRGERERGEGEDVEVCLECILHAFLRGSVTAAEKPNPRETCLCRCCCPSASPSPPARGPASLSPTPGAWAGAPHRPPATPRPVLAESSSRPCPTTLRVRLQSLCSGSSLRLLQHGVCGAGLTTGSMALTSWRAVAMADATLNNTSNYKNVKKNNNNNKTRLEFRVIVNFIHRILTMPAPATTTTTAKPIFPADQLRAWIRQLLATTLRDVAYDHANPGRMKDLSRGLSEKIKSQMLALHPHSFKYIITSTLTENKNQAGRGDLVCHWEGTDVAVQEMFSNTWDAL